MAGTRRVFFALWPAPEVAKRLHVLSGAAHALCGGRRMKRDTLHLTLAFLGEVDESRFDLACTIADGLAGDGATEAQVLHIDGLAYWKHNHIAWAGCDDVPLGLAALADALAAGLRDAGFALDSRRFAAHVTLLRNAHCAGAMPVVEPFDWPVRDFVLVQSHRESTGARYEIVRRWALPQPDDVPQAARIAAS